MGKDLSIVRRVEDGRLAATLAPPYSPIVPRVSVRVRVGTMADVELIDRLQKAQTREVGFLPTKAIEGKIARGQVLVAEGIEPRRHGGTEGNLVCVHNATKPVELQKDDLKEQFSKSLSASVSQCLRGEPVGYIIAADRYQKRDEIGYITQINVVPEYRRSLVAAALLQAQFDRSAYGCRLYGCWCAQDLTSANEFWEAMGFTAIAFRTGSRTKGKKGTPRIHIFWQKRIRAEDTGEKATRWWYPSTTGGGEMREDRLVFPIPPGVGWRDVLPVVLADGLNHEEGSRAAGGHKARSDELVKKPRAKKVIRPPRCKGGLWFKHEAVVERVALVKREENAKPSIDPRLRRMARELRDRWTEQQSQLILPAPAKHDVRRMIVQEMEQEEIASPALPQGPLPMRPLPKRNVA